MGIRFGNSQPWLIAIMLLSLISCNPPTDMLRFEPIYPYVAQLEFDYSPDWEIENIYTEGSDYQDLIVSEPGSPTPIPNRRLQAGVSDYGGIIISSKTGGHEAMVEQMEFDTEVIFDDRRKLNAQVSFQEIKISGSKAWRLEGVYLFPNFVDEGGILTYEDMIFFVVRDHYYWISFAIPESKIGDDFHNQYLLMIESLKVLP